MAISTIYTFLMYAESSTYSKLVDIKEFPDLGGEPENIDVTSLSDTVRKYITGVQDTGSLSFTANYTMADFVTVKALADGTSKKFAVWFGATAGNPPTPTGSNGKFSFEGTLSVFVNGGGVNDPVNMTIVIAPSSEITISTT